MPTPKPNTQAAPYSYTAIGRIRKKPLKSSVPLPVQNQNPYEKWRDNCTKFKECPACFKDFSHRPDSHIAVWQPLLHFATKDPKHQEVHDALKKIRDQKASVEKKKHQERISSAGWRSRNTEKAKRASAKFAIKLKIERSLKRLGEFSEEKLNKLLEEKIVEWDSNN
ncbi:uncharacterized protein H6S33_002361 [Morchella sextelata]|uniref:uncharacterized protein n=1 Tax=Morchella sextelata TaxID=1174677 RepID=UPI001D0505E2|nr:uncharacterized protein H6S33_002361 [Morchella sextelata]KAH0608309.1 hypothetical protein H6S33_002361 [Morchella sextelata]